MGTNDAFKKIKGLFIREIREQDIEALQETFRSHYHSFRSLLTANNNALELMAALEKALDMGQPFGMAFVRGHCTALSVNVYKLVKSLQEISGGRYGELNEAFSRITSEIEAILAKQPALPEGRYILPLSEAGREEADLVGDKMANLGEVGNRAGYKIPPGFVITASATQRFMSASGLQDEINRLLKTLDIEDLEALYTISAQIQKLISGAPVPGDVSGEILDSFGKLNLEYGPDLLVSMRSSAVGEDHRSISFAGQYRTQLNVSEEFLLQAYREIVASKYRSQAIVYRNQRGFRHQDVVMSVGCMAMVDADVSGVMFSRLPGNPHSAWVEINAAPGLASRVVDGSVKTDFYMIGRESPNKIILQEPAGGDSTLSLDQLRELADTAMKLEEHFGAPQDIEWSIDKTGETVILQSRPLAQPEGVDEQEVDIVADMCGEDAILGGGVTACRGAAFGPVHIVRSNVDLLEFPRGAILVVESPLPEWASLMSRAIAVISDTGHAATHLAIVAREFGVPAVFGAKGATRKLQNGTMVTVDATLRCVYPDRREEALARAAPPPNLMADSPIYRILKEITAHVLPLNLTDPGSPYFTPSHCKTLHDLTRFCHEKSVTEMFTFGEKAGYYAKAAKQLTGEAALKWWVINLDDGFREGYDSHEKYVFIQDIVSTPMLALWEGMMAKRWGGPPPVSLKGFGSILYRSTMNPSIDPAVRSSMGTKNYFLISKNFCNLSMRLGYHFTLVEGYLGSHLTENYVNFQFRGGAADRNRRFVRVYLLRDILEKYGFRVDILLDALTARIEKKPREFLLERLKVLGYLLIHTRQIDMVMGEQVMVDHYRRMIENDLARIVKTGLRGSEEE